MINLAVSWLIMALVISTWGIICGNRTISQRIKLRLDHKIRTENVSVDSHFWYLMTFRNPNKLYKDN